MKKYLLIGEIHYDGGTESDWSELFQEIISAKSDAAALVRARKIVAEKAKEKKVGDGGSAEGPDAILYGPLIKQFRYQEAVPARPAVKAKKAVKPGIVES
ncbi:MAG TPA: hypothetical protein VGE35_02740 [Candidatus Paceibacterota bacterium]